MARTSLPRHSRRWSRGGAWLVVPLLLVAFTWTSAAGASTSASSAKIAARTADAVPAEVDCAALVQKSATRFAGVPDFSRIPGAPTRIESATVVAATSTAPAYCDVKGYIATQIKFELKLPVSTWTGRYLQVGCGGFCGNISPTVFPSCAPLGGGDFAVAATDDGHATSDGTDAVWASRSQEARKDFGYRAVHVLSIASKAIIKGYYGQSPDHSYFQGCSDGGREGLMEAQRFPTDFNGIVVGAPANYMSLDPIWLTDMVRANTARDGSAILTADKLAPLHAAVVAACDADDGVTGDGLIGDPRDCRFDPKTVQCRSADAADCLTAAQVAVVRHIYRGTYDKQGDLMDPRMGPIGSELSWAGWWVPLPASASAPAGTPPTYVAKTFDVNAAGFLSYPIGQGKDLSDVKITRAEFRTLARQSHLYDAVDPDLTAFRKHGGKLLMYQGYSDVLNPPTSTLDYYGAVTRTMGGRAATQRFARLFMVPGMGHCGGGPSPSTSTLVQQVATWVEKGTAPDSILVRDQNSLTDETRQRPVFAYPLVQKYVGPDPVTDPTAPDRPENFVAAEPTVKHRDRLNWLGRYLLHG